MYPIQRNHMGMHLEKEVYDKLLKPRQSLWITLYDNDDDDDDDDDIVVMTLRF